MTEDQLKKLDELLELEDGLSDWEVGFIENLSTQRSNALSDRQADKLQQIWERLCN